ncbi:MAG: hypothetical protein IPI67_38525 [Myxococcales bacterium]|nr:hypothetical protein [Myxococcales bacterium]
MRRPDGDRVLTRDPLNQPALFLNLLPWLEVPEAVHGVLAEAWREMTYRTWGLMELKAEDDSRRSRRPSSSGCQRRSGDLFLLGCGCDPAVRCSWSKPSRRAGRNIDFANRARRSRACARLSSCATAATTT